jgi:hypothetical protein
MYGFCIDVAHNGVATSKVILALTLALVTAGCSGAEPEPRGPRWKAAKARTEKVCGQELGSPGNGP